jgi:hypothetical protein
MKKSQLAAAIEALEERVEALENRPYNGWTYTPYIAPTTTYPGPPCICPTDPSITTWQGVCPRHSMTWS